MQPRTPALFPALLPMALVALAACGSNAGSGDAGYTPLRGGFPTMPERRVAHAVQIRVTNQALRALEPAAPDLLAAFIRDGITVPRSDQTVQTGVFGNCVMTVCPAGCRVPVALSSNPAPLELAFVPTEQVRARVRLVIPNTELPITGCSLNLRFDVDTSRGARTFVGIEGTATLRQDTHNERYGYIRPEIGDVAETPGEGIENEDFRCEGGGVRNRLVCGVINNFARDTIRDRIREQFAGVVTRLRDALAQTANPDPPGCPAGLLTDGTRCFFRDQTPVPVLLGAEGQVSPAAILGSGASAIPGTAQSANGSIAFVLAAGDPRHGAEASETGITLDMLAAVVARQHNACVPQLARPAMPTIPEWTTLRQNTIPNSNAALNIGVGISEDALNYGLWNVWDGGAFCYDAASPLAVMASAELNRAAPAGSPVRTALGLGNGTLSLALRPQQPPRIVVGRGTDPTDPLVRVEFPQVALDVSEPGDAGPAHTVTITADLAMPVNLAPDPAGVRPTLGALSVRNLTVANGAPGAAAQISAALQPVLAAAATQFAGVIPPLVFPSVPVPGPSGPAVGSLRIAVAPDGVEGVTEGGARYLGIFGAVQYQHAAATSAQ